MNQDEINERERNNPGSWGKLLGFYHSAADSRLWVRKPQPWMGWSLNMANPSARVLVRLFILFTLLFCVMTALTVFSVLHK
jgi:uncharacterized membrane protein